MREREMYEQPKKGGARGRDVRESREHQTTMMEILLF
jgi:hypothetical protein